MGVLSVASETASLPQAESRRVGDAQQRGERVEPGERISAWVDEFLSGFIPGDSEISVDWGRLSPIASVISALVTAISAGGILAWA